VRDLNKRDETFLRRGKKKYLEKGFKWEKNNEGRKKLLKFYRF